MQKKMVVRNGPGQCGGTAPLYVIEKGVIKLANQTEEHGTGVNDDESKTDSATS